jgi:hypothetical protein
MYRRHSWNDHVIVIVGWKHLTVRQATTTRTSISTDHCSSEDLGERNQESYAPGTRQLFASTPHVFFFSFSTVPLKGISLFCFVADRDQRWKCVK